MPHSYSVFASGDIKVRYREPYITEGMNAKLAINTPRGCYRGFRLGAGGSNFEVSVIADSTVSDHVAVYEVNAGDNAAIRYSLTLRKLGGNFTLDLSSLNGVSPVTAYIVIYAAYINGATSSAEVRAYTAAEYVALSATLKGELLVLGTCVIPASGSPAPVTTFDADQRTMAWVEEANEAVAWSPIIRNQSFEHGVTAGTNRFAISDWENRADLATNGSFRIGTSTVRSGAKSLEVNKTAGSMTTRIEQIQEIPVAPGQLLRLSGWIRQLIAPTGGSYTFNLYWGDLDSTASGSTAITASVASSTDGAFRKVEKTFAVPTGKYVLKYATIEAVSITTASNGVAAVFDDFQVYLETGGSLAIPGVSNARMRAQIIDSMVVEDPNAYSLGQLAALVRYDRTAPTNEGKVVVERKDQDYTGGKLPPAMSLFGRLFKLGSGLLGTETDALKPRVSADISVAASTEFTLMWESGRNGETTGGYTQPVVRMYGSSDGRMLFTSNAIWGGTTWTKDVTGINATRFGIANDGARLYTRQPDAAWADNAWDDTMRLTNPMTSTADARTARISMGLREDSGAGLEFNLLAQFLTADGGIRIYTDLANTAGTVGISLMLVLNAAWDGTQWVKDIATDGSARIVCIYNGTQNTTPTAMQIQYELRDDSTATFTEAGWIAQTVSGGALLRPGAVQIGPIRYDVDNTVLSVFGEIGDIGTELMDTRNLIEANRFVLDSFGLPSPVGAYIFEEFNTGVLPARWLNGGAGGGGVTYNVDGLTRIQISGGTAAFIETDPTVAAPAYAAFNATLKWNNVTGSSFIGLADLVPSFDFGFVQDSGTYGDENLRITLRTGAGLQVHDTGIDISAGIGSWSVIKAYCYGGTGLVANSKVMWAIQSKKAFASGVFNVGAPPLTPTTGRRFYMGTAGGGSITVERCAIGDKNVFGI